jgi:hypothetical protein
VLEERTLEHLSGYEGARPVRGETPPTSRGEPSSARSTCTCARAIDLTTGLWAIVVTQVERALERWSLPAHGIWEVRGEPRHFTASKVVCWMAADRGARLAELRGDLERAVRWQSCAEEIRADVLAHAVDERDVFTQHYETTALDASVLLIPLIRLRDHCARGPGRQRRLAVPPADGLPERVRRRARDVGTFRLGPTGVRVPAARRYIPGTIVLKTNWCAPGGWIVVIDALLMGPWHHEHERSTTHRRAPTDCAVAQHQLVLGQLVRDRQHRRAHTASSGSRKPNARRRPTMVPLTARAPCDLLILAGDSACPDR